MAVISSFLSITVKGSSALLSLAPNASLPKHSDEPSKLDKTIFFNDPTIILFRLLDVGPPLSLALFRDVDALWCLSYDDLLSTAFLKSYARQHTFMEYPKSLRSL